MSLLNLNSPTGRSPRGKGSSRAWMGIGLIVAVLGIGSTFAANIQINDGDTSEFGQGLIQTVYCGENEEETITVTPIAAFVNSGDIDGGSVWRQPVYTGRQFITVSSISGLLFSRTKVILNDETGDGLNTRGYYVNSILNEDYVEFYRGFRSVPIISNPPSGEDFDTFVPQVVLGNNYGFYIYDTFTPGRFVTATASRFELGGITITDIPENCIGRDFIISAYGESPNPLEFSSVLTDNSDPVEVTEIAVNWNPTNTDFGYSFDRTTPGVTFGNNGEIDIEQAGDVLTITFASNAGRLLTSAFTKIVVETQENIVG
jgi:hypothetical protein